MWLYLFLIILSLTVVGLIVYILSSRREKYLTKDSLKDFLDLEKKMGEMTEISRDIKNAYRKIDEMLGNKTQRGTFGEFSLELVLKDALPQDKILRQAEVSQGGRVDAAIKTSDGLLPIDSKFPLENYQRAITSVEDSEKERAKSAFRRDVKTHVQKVKNYIQPQAGTTTHALLYVPSEEIYYYLISSEFNLVREANNQGVYIVSPTTLSMIVNVIKLGLQGEKLSQEAAKVLNSIRRLDKLFQDFEGFYSILGTHLRNAYGSYEKMTGSYHNLKRNYEMAKELEASPKEFSLNDKKVFKEL